MTKINKTFCKKYISILNSAINDIQSDIITVGTLESRGYFYNHFVARIDKTGRTEKAISYLYDTLSKDVFLSVCVNKSFRGIQTEELEPVFDMIIEKLSYYIPAMDNVDIRRNDSSCSIFLALVECAIASSDPSMKELFEAHRAKSIKHSQFLDLLEDLRMCNRDLELNGSVAKDIAESVTNKIVEYGIL